MNYLFIYSIIYLFIVLLFYCFISAIKRETAIYIYIYIHTCRSLTRCGFRVVTPWGHNLFSYTASLCSPHKPVLVSDRPRGEPLYKHCQYFARFISRSVGDENRLVGDGNILVARSTCTYIYIYIN